MNTNLSIIRLLGSKDFFPNEQSKEKEFYASRVGKDKLRKFSALFLSYTKTDEFPPIDELIPQWFTFNGTHDYTKSPSYTMVSEEFRRINRFHENENLSIISVESLLNIAVWVINNPQIPETVMEDASVTMPLFELNLSFNDDVLANYQKAVDIVTPLKDERHLQRLTLAMSFSQSDLLNIDYSTLLYTQLYKAMTLLDYLEATPKYQNLLVALLKFYERPTKEDLLKSMALASSMSLKTTEGWTILVVPKDANYDSECQFLDKMTIGNGQVIPDEQDDYLALRSNPLLKINDGQYLVLFDLFLVKKIYTGILFTLSALVNSDRTLLRGHFFGEIRMDFSEETLLYKVLQTMYQNKKGIVQYTGTQLKAAGLERESDYYVRDNNMILLFESKDFFMRGNIKLSYDFSAIEAELKNDSRLGKAIKQTTHNIKRVIDMGMPDKGYTSNTVEIYPIIITHDALYNCTGLNFWVHLWLVDEIQNLKDDPAYSGYNFSNIKPLTLIDIDTLTVYQNYFNSGAFDLSELIREFHAAVNYDGNNIQDMEQYALQSCIPFSEFVRETAQNRDISFDQALLYQMLSKYGVS